MPKLACLSALLLVCAASAMPAWSIDREGLAEVLNGAQRSAENKARDQYRHPVETLEFFGIESNMTVVESWPGGGWYTEVLAPYLNDNGKYIGAVPSDRGWDRWNEKLDAHPEVYGNATRVKLTEAAMAEPGTVDAILDFRNAHNWIGNEQRYDGLLKAWHAALKPGGIVGVVDHRMNADAETNTRGYIKEQELIDRMAEYGFELVEKSEVNANPKDPKDHARGVWTLPPNLALGDQDREKYLAIGESDRLTMKFRKK